MIVALSSGLMGARKKFGKVIDHIDSNNSKCVAIIINS